MARSDTQSADSRLDLVLTRVIDAPRALVWTAWTDPEHLKKWWTPAPYTTPVCEMDVRPGGIFRTVMRSPEGDEYDNTGIFLDVVEQERIVFTDALLPGWRPVSNPFMTAIITLKDRDGGTEYSALVRHKDEADRVKHEEMGFHQGWGTCIDQLAALVRQLRDAQ